MNLSEEDRQLMASNLNRIVELTKEQGEDFKRTVKEYDIRIEILLNALVRISETQTGEAKEIADIAINQHGEYLAEITLELLIRDLKL